MSNRYVFERRDGLNALKCAECRLLMASNPTFFWAGEKCPECGAEYMVELTHDGETRWERCDE